MEHRPPARGHQEFTGGSVLRGQSFRVAEGPLGFLSQISADQYAKYGLYPYPGTGPAGYNNDADRALLLEPVTSSAVIARVGMFCLIPASRGPRSKVPFTRSRSSGRGPPPDPQPAAPSTTLCRLRRPNASRTVSRAAARTPGQGLHPGHPAGLLQPRCQSSGVAEHPAPDADLQRHLHHTAVLDPAQVCEPNHQGLGDRLLRHIPKRDIPHAAQQHYR